MKAKAVVVLVLAAVVLVLLILSRFIWVADVVSGRDVVVAAIQLPEAGRVELIQHWAGRGYSTFVRHFPRLGEPDYLLGEHDAIKIWSADMKLEKELAHVRIRFVGVDWRYYYNSRSLIKRRAQ